MVKNSLRDKKDGKTYFGIISPDENQKDISIDFSTLDIIDNINNIKDNDIKYGKQFYIRFDVNQNCYLIKDCGTGYGSFMKIINQMKIMDNTLINIGNNYLVFTFGNDDQEQYNSNIESEKILSVKVFMGETHNYLFAFNQKQTNKITIGKNENCNIVLNDNMVDDIHCLIEYKRGLGWVIIDGYLNKKSERGTWICLSEETKIFEGMIIQSNQNIYECHIINNK